MCILYRVIHLSGKVLNLLLIVHAAFNAKMEFLVRFAFLKILALCSSDDLFCSSADNVEEHISINAGSIKIAKIVYEVFS